MTVEELARLAPAGSPAWDSRLLELNRAAVALAWAARPEHVTAVVRVPCNGCSPSAELCAGHTVRVSDGEAAASYWASLSPRVRTAWFVAAFNAAAGGDR